MEKYKMIPIKNLYDTLQVRIIRNECRNFMTNNTSKISFLKQIIWYFNTYKKDHSLGKITCFLFKQNNNNSGFGLIRKSSGKYWITGGLTANKRGKGLGTVLFENLVRNTPSKDVWLEVLDSNNVAKKLYIKLGFKRVRKFVRNGNTIIVMKLTKKK